MRLASIASHGDPYHRLYMEEGPVGETYELDISLSIPAHDYEFTQ